jgi:hypothetical protein
VDVPDFKKGMKVCILGGQDVWEVYENATDDDVCLKNDCGVVISCDYKRLRRAGIFLSRDQFREIVRAIGTKWSKDAEEIERQVFDEQKYDLSR